MSLLTEPPLGEGFLVRALRPNSRFRRKLRKLGSTCVRGIRALVGIPVGLMRRLFAGIAPARAGTVRAVMAMPGGIGGVAMISAILLAVTGYVWVQPQTTDRVQMRPFVVEYAFDYRAELPENPVYQRRELRFGDPLFLSVVDAVDVSVEWSVPRQDLKANSGKFALTSVLHSEAGWSRVLTREPVVVADGFTAASTIRLNFAEALSIAQEVDEATGVRRPVRLEVLAEMLLENPVSMDADNAAPLKAYSSATIAFVLDERVVRLVDVPVAAARDESSLLDGLIPGTAAASTDTGDASTGTGGASTDTGGASTETGGASRFQSTETEGSSSGSRVGVREVVQMFATDVLESNQVRLGPLRMEVPTAQRNFALLTLAALLALGLGAFELRKVARRGEAALIETRYGSMLTPLPNGANGFGAQAVDLGSFAAVHTLSLDRDTPIMVDRSHGAGTVAFYLFDGPVTYRYVATGELAANTSGGLAAPVP
jgi:hypothetical protein